MPGRNFNAGSYKYGFNGMEKDDNGCSCDADYTSEFRQYNSRIGRWSSLDPKQNLLPGFTPYAFSNNTPIIGSDANGDFCIPCLVLLVGLITAPNVAVAPTGKSGDAAAIQSVYHLSNVWVTSAFGGFAASKGGVLLYEAVSANGIASAAANTVLNAQKVYIYYAPTLGAAARIIGDVLDPEVASTPLSLKGDAARVIGSLSASKTMQGASQFFTFTFNRINQVLADKIGSAMLSDDGTLSLVLNLNKLKDPIYKGKGIGSMAFQAIVDNLNGAKISKIVGEWGENVSGGSDNLAAFNAALVKFGGNVTEAAKATFTGEMAKRLGFTTVKVIDDIPALPINGVKQFKSIELEFTKPN